MAGSLSHIVGPEGKFRMELIENMGDAHEALEECFEIICALTNGNKTMLLNETLKKLKYPELNRRMVSSKE